MKNGIAIVYLNLGPYHLARLEALSTLTPHLVAIEIGALQTIYPWKPGKEDLPFTLESLFDRPVEEVGRAEQKGAILRCLENYSPGAVIVSVYTHPGMRVAARWARERGLKDILLFSGTDGRQPRNPLREWLKGRLLRRFSSLAVAGQRSAHYAQRLGVPRENICVIGNVVDNEGCQRRAEAFRAQGTELRRTLNLPRDFFLFVGRISREKNLPMLLKAFFTYRKSGGTWDLVLVGAGPEMNALKSMASPTEGHISFAGWKQFDELMAYYALANCLVLPSVSETWGLVVNEAMACGLPVLVSENCGCAPDLCKNGINGHTFDPYDAEGLASLMAHYSNGKCDLRKMGVEGTSIIRQYTPDRWAHGLLETIAP
jgi:1,2-diacylglycerol 3-alpha-glucosyltransferase